MTATDELRKLLGERGAKTYHEQNYITWCDANDYQCFAFETYERPGLLRVHCNLTPEQAIAATLGTSERTCKAIPHLNLTIGNDFLTQNGLDCSECGGRLDLPVRAFYCPNCGAKVVEQ